MFGGFGFTLHAKIPTGVKALFENGGNISKGSSAGSDTYSLAQQIREKYPLLGLLGGCTDSFMLGDSNLHSVSAFWYGKEYNLALKHLFDVEAKHSTIDMLDARTLHRHSGRTHDRSPMPYSFETVATGAKLYVHFQFSPWTSRKEMGAFLCALKTYENIDSTIGGQSAKGFGRVQIECLDEIEREFLEGAEEYIDDLDKNLIERQEGLQTGMLGTDKVVCT